MGWNSCVTCITREVVVGPMCSILSDWQLSGQNSSTNCSTSGLGEERNISINGGKWDRRPFILWLEGEKKREDNSAG